jgi:predicted O-methyltransferase YrrM
MKHAEPSIAMHCLEEFLEDLQGHTVLSDALLLKWARDRYSISKHMLTLYAIATGLKPRRMLEIGMGRSTFVLARAAIEQGSRFTCCDEQNVFNCMSIEEKAVSRYIQGSSRQVWDDPEMIASGADFIFLDYFGTDGYSARYIRQELKSAFRLLPTNGVLAVHDADHPRSALPGILRIWKWLPGLELFRLTYNYGLALIRRTSSSPYGRLADPWAKKPYDRNPSLHAPAQSNGPAVGP